MYQVRKGLGSGTLSLAVAGVRESQRAANQEADQGEKSSTSTTSFQGTKEIQFNKEFQDNNRTSIFGCRHDFFGDR